MSTGAWSRLRAAVVVNWSEWVADMVEADGRGAESSLQGADAGFLWESAPSGDFHANVGRSYGAIRRIRPTASRWTRASGGCPRSLRHAEMLC